MAPRFHPSNTFDYFTLLTPTDMCMTLKEWEMNLYRGLPVLLTFAIIGLVTLLVGLAYLIYKVYQKKKPQKDRQDAEKACSVPWLAISSPQERPNFIPIHTSLNLVSRSEILNDPARRHGVDELDLWERKQNEEPRPSFWKFTCTDYPNSPESAKPISIRSSLTMQEMGLHRSMSEIIKKHDTHPIIIPHKNQCDLANIPSSSGDILLVRQALQESKIKNSSSEWLRFSGSKSF